MGETYLTDRLAKAISDKVGSIASLRLAWERALGKAANDGVEEGVLLDWLALCSSPRLFELFLAAHANSGESLDATLVAIGKDCDEAGVSREEFVAGIEQVLLYLEKHGRSSSPSKIEGYVFCTAEFVGQKTPVEPLVSTLREMLERYGFDG